MDTIRSQDVFVKEHPERRVELDAMGFVWDDLERRWELVRDALAVYKEVHGDLEVPWKFVVPSAAPWPAEAWGLQLGHSVKNIRARGDFAKKEHLERRAELDAMGFRWRRQ